MFRFPPNRFSVIVLSAVASSVAAAQPPTIGKCPVLPADNIWNTPVDQLPISPHSGTWVSTIGAGKGLHADFGSGLYNGSLIGIPYVSVPGTQAKYPATLSYASESDPGPYAVPLNAPVEGGGDRHVLSIDTDNCILYELYAAYPQTSGWTAGAGAIFNLLSNALRPSGWTSTDAAGLPVFPGLLRYDEVAAGEIRHAIRFSVPRTQRAFVWPARHFASNRTGSQYPPMGARFRLRAGFDISGFSPANQVILRALKRYGMILADNGSAWFISGTPDSRWDNSDLHQLGQIPGSNFEAVDVSGLMIDPDSGQAKQSNTVSVAVSPSAVTVPANATSQFTAVVTNANTQVVDWSVNNAPGGNPSAGWISSGGLYTAPAVPPPGGTVTVQAASSISPSAVGTATVTVSSPVPALNSVAPGSGVQGTSVAVALNGSNFQPGATVAVSGSGVSVANVTVVSANQITATLAIAPTATAGARGVTVRTAAGASAPQYFSVSAAAPPPSPAGSVTLAGLSPSAGPRGIAIGVMLTGTNFTSPATVTCQGGAVNVTNVAVLSPTMMIAAFRISRTAAPGPCQVTVTTSAGTSNAQSFTLQ